MKNIFKNTAFMIVAAIVVLVLLTWGSIALLSHRPEQYVPTTVTRRDLTESVTATGNVAANEDVTLAFNMQGRVSKVYVDVGSTTYAGEVLASLDSTSVQAQLTGANADVAAAQAQYTQMENGTRPEELTIYEQKYNDASSALLAAMKSAYFSAEDAVVNKADQLFVNGDTVNPVINIRTQSQTEQYTIDQERLALKYTLENFKDALANFNPPAGGLVATSSFDTLRTTANNALDATRTYLDDLGTIAGNVTNGNSGLSDAALSAYRSDVNGASQEVSGATTQEQAADAAWSSARDTLNLELAGSTNEDILASQSTVAKTQAIAQGLQSQLTQGEIISPFAGLVTAMNVKVGEVYVPGISADEGIDVISNNDYKIEVYVPETDIGKIQAGDKVDVTFDAYGPDTIFPATVYFVDPAQTVQNGINAYKVTITFDQSSDSRIKSGLTSNVVIYTQNLSQVLAVPTRAIITQGSDKFVLVKQTGSNQYVQQKVTTGISSADGYTQIVSGLDEGQAIASF